jgi:hypothetical protein
MGLTVLEDSPELASGVHLLAVTMGDLNARSVAIAPPDGIHSPSNPDLRSVGIDELGIASVMSEA